MGINIKASTNSVENSVKKIITLPSRNLTPGEIALSKLIFKESIDYSKVKIFTGDYLPNQDPTTFVTPNGNIYAPREIYLPDYSAATTDFKKVFLHEMGHVWQYQSDVNVLVVAGSIHACAYFTKKDPYLYDIHELKKYKSEIMPNLVEHLPKKLLDYNLESQAEILADYWLIKYTNKQVQYMKIDNIKTNIKGAWSSIVQIYEEKVRQVIP